MFSASSSRISVAKIAANHEARKRLPSGSGHQPIWAILGRSGALTREKAMNDQQAEELHEQLLEAAAEIIGRGERHAALLFINPHGSAWPREILQMEPLLIQFGKDMVFAAIRKECLLRQYENVAYIDEAWAATFHADDQEEVFADYEAGKQIEDMEGSFDCLAMHIEDKGGVWAWHHKIEVDDAGNRLIDTSVKVAAATNENVQGVRFLK